jgi:alpha,alpha-trehalose phosphorylase
MFCTDCFEHDPWAVREVRLDLERMGQSESIMALSNGHIGWRANLDEGEPHVISGSYLNAFYESVPLPYAETAYGYPEAGQTIVNITDGKIIRLLVDDEPFDVRYGKLHSHVRTLDFKSGLLKRVAEWESPAHRLVRVRSTRLVSLAHRALAAILYEVEPLEDAVDLVVQSELVANEPGGSSDKTDPRTAKSVERPLVGEFHAHNHTYGVLIHSTRSSHLRMAAAMQHVVEGPRGTALSSESGQDHARLTVTAHVKPGGRLRIVKFVAYGWSSLRSQPALRSQVEGALASGVEQGWDGLAAAQRKYLGDFWRRADVELEGDPDVQQGIRFSLFHVLQAAARAETRAIPAKGLTGPGYDGHTFWDMESFVLPVLTYTAPATVPDALRWRHFILDKARKRARDLGFEGAAFPWRTIRGEECSGYWPASTAAMHINADIADAVLRYVSATNDVRFEEKYGAELLVETARLWMSIGHFARDGTFRIDGVTGPDEYTALCDNNVYTNLMAQQNLTAAADAVERQPSAARRLNVKRSEIKDWRKAAAQMYVPYDEQLGVHPQASQFTDHDHFDFGRCKPDHYPLFLHFPYFDLYRKQVIKQADLVLALHLRGDAFSTEDKARNFDYYEAITVRDSSLSSTTQSTMAAEVGHMQLAHDYLGEAALMDLNDLEHNVKDGVHMGSLAGAWLAAVAGLGGMRHHGDELAFRPQLPPAIRRLTFRMTFQGRLLQVRFNHSRATYSLIEGRPLDLKHFGQEVHLTTRTPAARPIPKLAARPEPKQPAGRAPARRGAAQPKPRPLRRTEPKPKSPREAATGGKAA